MEAAPNIITRAEAKSIGQSWYYTGEPCAHGHIGKRLTHKWGCAVCESLRQEQRRAKKRSAKQPRQLVRELVSITGSSDVWRTPGLSDADKYRLRYVFEPDFQVKERLRRQLNKRRKRDDVADMVRSALKRNGNSPTAERLLGYSLADLKAHIERQFTNGMTWARFLAGEIHIDHIKPQASFDLSAPDEWKRCWCLSNLRPLWARENLQKGARIELLV